MPTAVGQRPGQQAWKSLTVLLATALLSALSALSGPASAGAEPTPDCPRHFAFVHDMAGAAEHMAAFADRVGADPDCTVIAEYGRTPLTTAVRDAGGPTVAGLTAIDESAAQIARQLRAEQRPDSKGWTVVAQGAGGLVAQRIVQRERTAAPIDRLVTVGPIWRGTNIGFLGDTEDISRRLGTYDAILSLEKPLIDPWCGGCRELVRGSDLLRDLHRSGLPTAGVRYTNVISPTDVLVSDPFTAAVEGMDNRFLNARRIDETAHHFTLLTDAAVIGHVRGALTR